jgi:hypothetical protein
MSLQTLFRLPFLRSPRDKKQDPPKLRGINYCEAVAAFEAVGFWVLREGVHVVMTDGRHILTIPCQDPVNAYTMDGIVRDSGLKIEKFRQLV